VLLAGHVDNASCLTTLPLLLPDRVPQAVRLRFKAESGGHSGPLGRRIVVVVGERMQSVVRPFVAARAEPPWDTSQPLR
jgi:hypothetical protein